MSILQNVFTDAEFLIFRAFLEKHSGILLGDNKHYLVSSRLGHLLKRLNYKSLNDLVTAMEQPGGSALLQEVIELMTTHETLWFRDIHPFNLLKTKLLPEVQQTHAGSIRIWSAASSTGQEAYSISMIVDEYQSSSMRNITAGVDIIATDISRQVVKTAQEGIYEELALSRGLSNERKMRFFDKLDGGRCQVKANIRDRVKFKTLNLLDTQFGYQTYDIVFCRNVLIYFSNDLKAVVLNKIAKSLKPKGFLFLGASESISGLCDQFEMLHCNPGIVYQKK